jgi:pteridine reductase
MSENTTSFPVALVTGSSQRLGAHIVRKLHARNMRVVIHYRQSCSDARALAESLESIRPESTMCVQGDLALPSTAQLIMEAIRLKWGSLDLLVNNAALFYPTPVSETTNTQWDELMAVNLRAPWLLMQAALPLFGDKGGCIINIVDIYAERPKHSYAVYCSAKSGLVGLTRAMACDLAPMIRVNAVAPGAILWHEGNTEQERSLILRNIPLGRIGTMDDIANAVCYLADAQYITGQVLNVDGGRSISD